MNEIERADLRAAKYARAGGLCESCKLPVDYRAFQLAHRIADTGPNRRAFGDHVVDHPDNLAVTHAGACNDRQNIGNNPGAAWVLAATIEADLVKQAMDVLEDPLALPLARPLMPYLVAFLRDWRERRAA